MMAGLPSINKQTVAKATRNAQAGVSAVARGSRRPFYPRKQAYGPRPGRSALAVRSSLDPLPAATTSNAPTAVESACGGIGGGIELERTADMTAWQQLFSDGTESDVYSVECSELPADLKGTLFRNGPAKFKVGGDRILHPFDGDGMMWAVTLNGDGKALFRNKFVQTEGYQKESEAGKMLYPGQFGNPLPLWAGGMSVKNVANTNAQYWGGKLYALWEAGKPHELDPLSLATVGPSDLGGVLGAEQAFSAHPRYDANTGRLVSFEQKPHPFNGTTVTFWEFEDDMTLAQNPVTFQHEGFALHHDFIITENYYVLVQAPTKFQMNKLLGLVIGKVAMGECIEFVESEDAVVHLIPRYQGPQPSKMLQQPLSVPLDSFFAFHFANGFEDPDTGSVVLDIVRVPKLALGDMADGTPVWENLDYGEYVPVSTLQRYTVDPRAATWTASDLCNGRGCDFPVVPDSVSGKGYRFTYMGTGSTASGSSQLQGVAKVDTSGEGQHEVWLPAPHQFVSEVAFAPREGAAEDDGYLLAFLFDGLAMQSHLLVFDAAAVAQGPIARVPMRHYVPWQLHGTFAPGLTPSEDDIKRASS